MGADGLADVPRYLTVVLFLSSSQRGGQLALRDCRADRGGKARPTQLIEPKAGVRVHTDRAHGTRALRLFHARRAMPVPC